MVRPLPPSPPPPASVTGVASHFSRDHQEPPDREFDDFIADTESRVPPGSPANASAVHGDSTKPVVSEAPPSALHQPIRRHEGKEGLAGQLPVNPEIGCPTPATGYLRPPIAAMTLCLSVAPAPPTPDESGEPPAGTDNLFSANMRPPVPAGPDRSPPGKADKTDAGAVLPSSGETDAAATAAANAQDGTLPPALRQGRKLPDPRRSHFRPLSSATARPLPKPRSS